MNSRIIKALSFAGLVCITIAIARPQALPEQTSEKKPEPTSQSEKVRQWRTAVAQHVPGQPDSAAATIGNWQSKDLQTVINFITKLAAQPESSLKRTLAKAQFRRLLDLTDEEVKRGNLNRILKKGALLHTDIASLELGKGIYRREGMGAFVDGQVIAQPKTLHWEFARQLVDSVSSLPAPDPTVKQWYLATITHLQSRRLIGYAEDNLKHGLEKFPSDDQVLFYAGALHEHSALPKMQNAALPIGAKTSYGSTESELKLARQLFQKAISANPSFPEAHLRLGRVLGLLGHHREALAELQQATVAIKDPQLSYYASLFLGFEFAVLSRKSEAREQYEQAAALYPTAQSPLLALSQLAHSDNDVNGALLSLQRVFGLPHTDRWNDDPWWIYDVSHVRDATARMDEMRKAFGGLPK